jgi:flagellar hook-associated protein 2
MSIQLSGLGTSGVDTQAVIEALMEEKKAPMTALEEEVYEDENILAVWEEIDERFEELDEAVSDLTDYTVWSQRDANSSDEDVFEATGSSSATKGSYYIVVEQMAQPHRVASSNIEDLYDAGYVDTESIDAALGLSGEFTLNDVTITVEESDSMEDIVEAINDASSSMDLEVSAEIIGDCIVIETAEGTSEYMEFSETGAENSVLRYLGILDGTPGDTGTYTTVDGDHEVETPQLLQATVNGVSVTSTTNEGVTDFVQNVTLDFYEVGDATLKIEEDYETVMEAMEDFIAVYNDIIDYVDSAKLAELNDNDDSLSSVGILQGDMLINNISLKLRSIVTSICTDPNVMDQDYNSLYKIGIWFDDDNYLEIYDEDLFEESLEYHFTDVEDLCRAYESDRSDGGIFRALDDYIYDLIDPAEGSITYKITNLETEIDDKEDKIEDMSRDLEEYEEDLLYHYAWMEETVTNVNSQLQYLTSALGV